MSRLAPGDKVAILSPASVINPEYVSGAVSTLQVWGLRPVVMPHTLGTHGSFSGTADERMADLRDALADPEVKALFCSRGGYGCVHLLPELDRLSPATGDSPKWLIGFSDVSALHALWNKWGWPSVHASMTKHLTVGGAEDPINRLLLSILQGKRDELSLPTGFSGSPYGNVNKCGETVGKVVGGNMAVLGGLVGTPFNPIKPGTILLVEDIAEPIYKVERILWQLRLAGIFDKLAGLIVGQFTDYKAPSRDHNDIYEMFSRFLAGVSFPVAMDVPVGHVDDNLPVLLNRTARMTVTPGSATLHYL